MVYILVGRSVGGWVGGGLVSGWVGSNTILLPDCRKITGNSKTFNEIFMQGFKVVF